MRAATQFKTGNPPPQDQMQELYKQQQELYNKAASPGYDLYTGFSQDIVTKKAGFLSGLFSYKPQPYFLPHTKLFQNPISNFMQGASLVLHDMGF